MINTLKWLSSAVFTTQKQSHWIPQLSRSFYDTKHINRTIFGRSRDFSPTNNSLCAWGINLLWIQLNNNRITKVYRTLDIVYENKAKSLFATFSSVSIRIKRFMLWLWALSHSLYIQMHCINQFHRKLFIQFIHKTEIKMQSELDSIKWILACKRVKSI